MNRFLAYRFSFVSILFLLLTQHQIYAQQNTKNIPTSHTCGTKTIDLDKRDFFESESVNNYDVYYQILNFKIDLNSPQIQANVAFFYQAKTDINKLILHLNSESLTVDSIKRNHQTLLFQHSENTIKVEVGNIAENQRDSVLIFYHGTPNSEHFFRTYQDDEELYPVISTLSEPYGASDWWPCKNTLTDKIDSIDINITCPKNSKAGSLGILENIEDIDNGNWHIFHWKHRYPVVPYLVSIAVSNYKAYHKYIHINEEDSIYFMNYIYQDNLDFDKIDTTESIMKIFDSLFIPYPFSKEKYGHCQFPWGGGMEHQTMSSMVNFKYGLISHELAHQWFGDYITCGSWADLWLNESFATYCERLCLEYEDFPDKENTLLNKRRNQLYYICSNPAGSVFPADTLNFNSLFSGRLTYYKGSFVLQMIRFTIGDEAFFSAVRKYLLKEELAYSFAKTPDLIQFFEQEADTSLTQFIDDWYYGESYPIFTLKYTQNESNQKVTLNLSQQSADENQNKFFDMYVPIRLYGENTTLDLKLRHQYNGQIFEVEPNFNVLKAEINPDYLVITQGSIVEKGQINDYGNKLNIQISPNPSKGIFQLSNISKIQNISVHNLQGVECKFTLEKNQLNIEQLPSGIYFLNIKIQNQQYTYKLLKE